MAASRPGVLACLLLIAAGCATPRPAPDSLRVDELRIEGTRAISSGQITDKLVTSATPFWVRWFPFVPGAEWFDVNAWQADLRRISRVYESHGYYQARVLEDLVTETGDGSVRLRVKVVEGSPALLRTLDVRGLELVPQVGPGVRAKLPLTLGTVFLEEHWADTKSTVVRELHQAGYAEVSVKGEAVVDLDGPHVDARLEVEPGPRFRFGPIYAPVTGSVVPSKLIVDVASSEVPRGGWYSDSALAEAQARVFQMGVFSAVKVTRGIADRETLELPIIIDAREAPIANGRLGGGAGGDLFRNEVRVFGEYTNRNLGFARLFSKDTLLDKLTLRGRVGYAFLPNLPEFIRLSAEKQPVRRDWVFDTSVQYEVPRAFGTRTVSLITRLGFNRVFDLAFDYLSSEAKVGLLWKPRVDVSVVPSVNLNGYVLNTAIQQSATVNTASAAVGCPVASGNFGLEDICLLAFLDLTAEWDRVDNKLEPRKGFSVIATGQVGLSARAASTVPFVKFQPEVRGSFSFGPEERFTVSGRLRAGVLVSFGGETPIVTRFFSGGSYMRGFNQRRFSPMTVVQTRGNGLPCQPGDEGCVSTAVPVGGNGLLEAGVELRYRLSDLFVLAAFVDSGAVTTDPRVWQQLAQDFYTAVGVGLRIRTPLGPIRGDFAFRLPFLGGPLLRDGSGTVVAQPVCFFGEPMTGSGAPDGLCTVHLSIGEAF